MDVAALRQRVLESLKKKPDQASEDSEIEEGEIQEAVDRSIAAKTVDFSTTSGINDPSMLPFQAGIPGLRMANAINLNGTSSYKPLQPISMPQDLPIAMTSQNAKLAGQIVSAGRQTPPWLPQQTASRAHLPGAYGKRAGSGDFATSSRPTKRFGTNRHPSLVIDLESDDENHAHGTDLSSNRTLSSSSLGDGAAKLRQVEAEIAQAMAIINHAQQAQNAKRAKTPQSEAVMKSAISSVDSSPRALNEEDNLTSLKAPSSVQPVVLETLQTELVESERLLVQKRKELQDAQVQDALATSQNTIETIKAKHCQEVITSIQNDLTRLQKDLAASQLAMAEVTRSRQELADKSRDAKAFQDDLLAQISREERHRQDVFDRIAVARAELVRQSPRSASTKDKSLPVNARPGLLGNGVASSSRKVAEKSHLSPVHQQARNPPATNASLSVVTGAGARTGTASSASTSLVPQKVPQARVVVQANSSPVASMPTTLIATQNLDSRKPGTTRIDEPRNLVQEKAPSLVKLPSNSRTNHVAMLNGDSRTIEPASIALYQSPLSIFNNFKYNALYRRSIQHNKVMCSYETQAEACPNLPDCQNQHFAAIKMTGYGPFSRAWQTRLTLVDDEILVELSSRTIGKTNKDRMTYREGLRAVLQEMKLQNIDDFEQVCARMVEYRRTQQEHPDQSISSFF